MAELMIPVIIDIFILIIMTTAIIDIIMVIIMTTAIIDIIIIIKTVIAIMIISSLYGNDENDNDKKCNDSTNAKGGC